MKNTGNKSKTRFALASTEHYFQKEYDSKTRFISYWHQINELLSLGPNIVLEIGIGNRFLSDYLKSRRINIVTLDFDKRLNPDIAGSVLLIPFHNESFDVVACYEVLEHLPYQDFPDALGEIYRVSSRYVILSLPDSTRFCLFNIQIPKIKEAKKLISLPWLKVPEEEIHPTHYWEIGTKKYPLQRVVSEIRNTGFEVKKTYRVFELPHHRFFVLEKSRQ